MIQVKALVLTGFGLNCDHETAYACRLVGAETTIVHINSLIDGSIPLENYHLLVFVGGFSWGDDHGAGVIQAVRMQTNLGDQLLAFISKGNLVLGICNGFQTLVNMGLLPGFALDYTKRQVALTYNDCGNFRDDWIPLKVNPKSPCVFTQGMDRLELPIRHGEGKFVTDDVALRKLSDDHQVVIQYATPNGDRAGGRFPYNPNGSLNDIAGICDPTGRVFGLMPHPEAYNHWTNHPNWTIKKEQIKRKGGTLAPADVTLGIRIFQNAVQFLQKNAD